MNIYERYHAVAMTANSTAVIPGDSIYGFIAVAAGTLSVLRNTGTSVLNSFPVTAGVYYPLPIYLGPTGGSVVLGGGAAGTLLK